MKSCKTDPDFILGDPSPPWRVRSLYRGLFFSKFHYYHYALLFANLLPDMAKAITKALSTTILLIHLIFFRATAQRANLRGAIDINEGKVEMHMAPFLIGPRSWNLSLWMQLSSSDDFSFCLIGSYPGHYDGWRPEPQSPFILRWHTTPLPGGERDYSSWLCTYQVCSKMFFLRYEANSFFH